jgi:hypothetical protein
VERLLKLAGKKGPVKAGKGPTQSDKENMMKTEQTLAEVLDSCVSVAESKVRASMHFGWRN